MALRRVSRAYLADDSGLRQLGTSSAVASATLAAAKAMASAAQGLGKGEYSVSPTIVTAGWANEQRAGAVVRETRRDWRDVRDTVLLKVADAMGRRGK